MLRNWHTSFGWTFDRLSWPQWQPGEVQCQDVSVLSAGEAATAVWCHHHQQQYGYLTIGCTPRQHQAFHWQIISGHQKTTSQHISSVVRCLVITEINQLLITLFVSAYLSPVIIAVHCCSIRFNWFDWWCFSFIVRFLFSFVCLCVCVCVFRCAGALDSLDISTSTCCHLASTQPVVASIICAYNCLTLCNKAQQIKFSKVLITPVLFLTVCLHCQLISGFLRWLTILCIILDNLTFNLIWPYTQSKMSRLLTIIFHVHGDSTAYSNFPNYWTSLIYTFCVCSTTPAKKK